MKAKIITIAAVALSRGLTAQMECGCTRCASKDLYMFGFVDNVEAPSPLLYALCKPCFDDPTTDKMVASALHVQLSPDPSMPTGGEVV